MSYKVLYRKYRPNDFENVVGQEYTVEMLRNAISNKKNSHAYIFTGPRGTGKTSSAKIFAKALNCMNPHDGNPCNECESCLSFKDNPDIIEIDAASNNGVDEIRELINNVKLVPTQSKYKVYIIDEVHMLTTSAFNALLLTLEEPPSHVVFILATTDIQDVPITILSRCQRFDFKPISKDCIISRLKYVCKEEKIRITDDALAEIALISAGGMRDALGMLDQLANDEEEVTVDMVSDYFGSVSVKKINELLTSISNNNVNKIVEILGNIKESGTNYAVFIDKLILELRRLAIELKTGYTDTNLYYEDIYNMIFDLNECLCNVNINIDPYVLIEVILLKYVKLETGNNIINNQQSVVGNNKNIVKKSNEDDKKYNPGNNLPENGIKDDENSILEGNIDEVNEEKISESNDENLDFNDSNVDKAEDVNNKNIDVSVRINNCFVNSNKKKKEEVSDSWIDFMNYLMKKNRNFVSLLADTIVLAASDKYILIQSKVNSTNELINKEIFDVEKLYGEFSNNNYRFAAVDSDLWKKESEKCMYNMKNKIKYSYIAEEFDSIEEDKEEVISNEIDDMESLAKDIFDTYEVQ